jgi:hypothetical protein
MLKTFTIGLTLILLTLPGCGKSTPAIRDFCLHYQPVYTSSRDTEETRDSADKNNATYEELCFEKYQPLGGLGV